MTKDTSGGWEIYDESIPFAGRPYGPQRARMVIVGLGGGSLLVVSPGGSMTDALWEKLAEWGTPKFLLAPNSYHNLGIPKWKQRFPDAAVVAHPRAIDRLRKKLPGIEVSGLETLQAALPEGMRVFGPPMAKQGETWVSLKTKDGVAWFVTDAMLNEEKLPGGPTGVFLWIVGFRTKLMTNPFFKRLFLTDKKAYKAWMRAEIDRDKPSLFVPAHGLVLQGDDVCSRLQAATDEA